MDTVQDIMSKNVKTSEESESLYSVAGMMKKSNISTVIITKQGKPIGIITERVLRNCL